MVRAGAFKRCFVERREGIDKLVSGLVSGAPATAERR
jgi:hypothetical protein